MVSNLADLAQAASVPRTVPVHEHKHGTYWKAASLIALIGWLYAGVLARLAMQWWTDPNFSHGFFVPLFSAYVVWEERKQLASVSLKPSWWGVPLVAFALSLLVIGTVGAELFLARISLIFLLAAVVILLCGWQYFRAVLFPWTMLFLMVPIPAIIFNQITFPLQILASKVAAWVLPLAGVPVLREGNIINLPAMPLEVAQACSGIRSLLSLVTLAIIYGYLTETRKTVRVILALASVPIAVAANSVRIIGTGLLVQYWDPNKAEGFFHAFSGWLIFVVSLLMLFLLHRVLAIRPKIGTA